MRKFWAIATLNLLVLGGISAYAVMAILAGHAVSGIGAPDALTWGMAAVGPLALLLVAVLAVRLHRGGSAPAEPVDPAIAADLPGSVAVNADDAARSRLSRFARPTDLGEEPAPVDGVDLTAGLDTGDGPGHESGADADDAGAADELEPAETQPVEEWPLTESEDHPEPFVPAPEALPEDPAGWNLLAGEEQGWDVADQEQGWDCANQGDSHTQTADPVPGDQPVGEGSAELPPFAVDGEDMRPAAYRELPAIADWLAAEEVAAAPVALEPMDFGIAPPGDEDADGLEGLPITRLKFTMPAERLATQWNWVYIDGAYYVAPAAETGFPWVTAGIAHIAGAITASRLLPMGSQAAAEARGWREAVAGFDRSEQIDPADGEAFASWINSLDTGDDAALRAAIDGALDALKAEAQRDHALAARLPAQFGVGQGGEAGGIALAG